MRRLFTVLRCNHCQDAPCVNICPTRALFHREDGIVDFDKEECIACKSCMAACPYDAIYIDPFTETAAKCNYCAHRIESGVQPVCVTICPGQAIIAGDLADPQSVIAHAVSYHQVTVRKPGKETRPTVFYIDGDRTSLAPGAAPTPSASLRTDRSPAGSAADFNAATMAATVWTTCDVPHREPWGLPVSLSFWLKSMAAGPIIVASLLMLLGYARAPLLFGRIAPLAALAFTSLTAVLLIADLGQPGRFLKILSRPNPRSWLVWGTQILIAYSVIAFLWLAGGLLLPQRILALLLLPGLILSVLAAGHSALVLAQARARDLWQSRLLFPHLVAQAFLAGSAVLTLGAIHGASGRLLTELLLRCTLGGVVLHGILVLIEVALPHGNQDAAAAVRCLIQGRLAGRFWLAAIFGGIALPIYVLAFCFAHPGLGMMLPALACAAVLLGLLIYQDCYLRAGQALPLN